MTTGQGAHGLSRRLRGCPADRPLDERGGWRYQIAQELKALDYSIDFNKL